MNKKPLSQINIAGQTVDPASVTIPTDRKFRDCWALNGEVIEVDWAKARTEFRKTASIGKVPFCLALVAANILTEEQAIDAAKGNWPSAFDDAFNEVDAATALEAKIAWAAVTEIHRAHPMLDALVAHPNVPLTAEQLDTVFGYEGQ